MGDGDVVVGETVDQHKRALEFRCVLHDAVSVVDIRVEAQIALGVVRVVQRPVGGRGAGACGLEHVRRVQHGQCGQEAAVRPADHTHLVEVRCGNAGPAPIGVEPGDGLGKGVDGFDLIGQRHALHVLEDCAIPGRAAACGATAVRRDHQEALVGPPLALPVEGLGGDDLLEAGPAVRLHQHRQFVGMGVRAGRARRDDRRVQPVLAQPRERDVRREPGFRGGAGDVGGGDVGGVGGIAGVGGDDGIGDAADGASRDDVPHPGAGGTHIAPRHHHAACAA